MRLDRQLQTLTGVDGPVFAAVPPAFFHVTLVNHDHFDSRPSHHSIHRLHRSKKDAVDAVIATLRCGTLTLRFDGLLLTASGRLLVPGFAEAADVFRLKEALRAEPVGLALNYPSTTHIKLGHLLVSLRESSQLPLLLAWVAEQGRTIQALIGFEDVYTPLGRIPL